MTVDAVTPDVRARLEAIGTADLVVAATGCTSAADLDAVSAALRSGLVPHRATRIVVIHDVNGVAADAEGDGGGADRSPMLVACPLSPPSRLPFATTDARDSFRVLFAIAAALEARACALLGSQAEALTATAAAALITPLLDANADLALPAYPRGRFDGLIDKGIVYPLTRALFGCRVPSQLGVDFGFSRRMIARLDAGSAPRRAPLWFLTEAVCGGLEVCQSHLEAWRPPAEDPLDPSSALTHVLGPLFLEVERAAPCWQKVRGSRPVRSFGVDAPAGEAARPVDVRAMIESFQLGWRNLQDIWRLVLPPATLLELGGVARLAPDAFRVPDELWARVLFDFTLGHRLRVISRDHLLGAITPIYLAWVASFALEVKDASNDAVRNRLEQFAGICERSKPYLIARWRWPDRFNP